MPDPEYVRAWVAEDAARLDGWAGWHAPDRPTSRAQSGQEGRADRDLTEALAAELGAWRALLQRGAL